MIATNPSIINLSIKTIGPHIVADRPKTKRILKILLPMIFPTLKSSCPLKTAMTDVINSGSDVPNATIVNPINLLESPIAKAIWSTLSITNWLPRTIPIIPNIIY